VARKSIQEERRLQILKALDSCLQDKSFEKTSIKDIACVAGVNHGVLHYYFSSKEDILLNYIDYVIDDYQSQVKDLLSSKDVDRLGKRELIEMIFGFINDRITLNKGLSRIFVEIWEIALYHDAVRAKVREAYMRWFDELVANLGRYIDDKQFAIQVSIAMVAFWEGMALFSTVFEPGALDIKEVLKGFQYRILDII
jgi:TetR/AcrR family transcriptional repressor of bet genes